MRARHPVQARGRGCPPRYKKRQDRRAAALHTVRIYNGKARGNYQRRQDDHAIQPQGVVRRGKQHLRQPFISGTRLSGFRERKYVAGWDFVRSQDSPPQREMPPQVAIGVEQPHAGNKAAGQKHDKKEILQAGQEVAAHASILHKKATQSASPFCLLQGTIYSPR